MRRARELRENVTHYDRACADARLELLEEQCLLRHTQTEVAALRSGERFPAMDSQRRADHVADLDEEIVRYRAAVEHLTLLVGDPEDVPDEHGLLPRDRRVASHQRYERRRIAGVRALREQLADLEPRIMTTRDRSERARLRRERDSKKRRHDELLAIPRQEIEDMCADCALPASLHGYVSPPFAGPCFAWPGQRAILARVSQMLKTHRERREVE